MKVDVRLCGAIPRSEWIGRARLTSSYLAATNALANAPTAIRSKTTNTIGNMEVAVVEPPEATKTLPPSLLLLSLPSQNTNDDNNNNSIDINSNNNNNNTIMPLLEPPTWAVPAAGEARLEPVCEALGKHAPIDLTTRSFFRVGRSPASHVQLLHGTSSRRHAMIFHHPNGSCYIVDCGSAHGTFVNGHRIVTKTCHGWVVPHKVRRGSLVRFGGPGAPAFVLKSFAIGFSAMVSLDEEDGEEIVEHLHPTNVQPLMASQSLSCNNNKSRATLLKNPKWLLQVNTRLNAMGRSVSSSNNNSNSGALIETSGNVIKPKRSCHSFDSNDDDDDEYVVPCKRPRCMSPPLSPEAPIRLVSPEATLHHSAISTKRVTFSEDFVQPFYPALVSPEELSDNEDHDTATVLAPMSTTTTTTATLM